ncbi:MAG: signal peptidase II [Bdellovibrionota bacterium]|jgi:signal peptidase II|nr:signal peptidase II [Bdellovibrionota bacterium]
MKSYSNKTRFLIFIPTVFILIAFDQMTKIWAVETLKGHLPRQYFFGMAQLTYAENTGAWGNLGGNWDEPYRSLFLIFLPIIVLVAFSLFALFSKKINKLEFWSYCLIAAGGAGNLIDRIRFNFVVDFLYLGIKRPFETNIFNIADVVIMTGFGFMLLNMYQDWRSKKVVA